MIPLNSFPAGLLDIGEQSCHQYTKDKGFRVCVLEPEIFGLTSGDSDSKQPADIRRVILLAGIIARGKDIDGKAEELSSAERESNKQTIRHGVPRVCAEAARLADGEPFHLVFPVISEGGGGEDKDLALDRMLFAINDAALNGNTPSHVSIAVYGAKSEWIPVVKQVLSRETVYDRERSVWSFARLRLILLQAMLVLLAVSCSALVCALNHRLPVILTWSAVIGQGVIWVVVALTLLNRSTWQFGEAMPRPALEVALVCAGAFVLPLWTWHRFGRPRERSTTSS